MSFLKAELLFSKQVSITATKLQYPFPPVLGFAESSPFLCRGKISKQYRESCVPPYLELDWLGREKYQTLTAELRKEREGASAGCLLWAGHLPSHCGTGRCHQGSGSPKQLAQAAMQYRMEPDSKLVIHSNFLSGSECWVFVQALVL